MGNVISYEQKQLKPRFSQKKKKKKKTIHDLFQRTVTNFWLCDANSLFLDGLRLLVVDEITCLSISGGSWHSRRFVGHSLGCWGARNLLLSRNKFQRCFDSSKYRGESLICFYYFSFLFLFFCRFCRFCCSVWESTTCS